MEIETHQELGEEGLLEEDKYLLEVNLEDLETTNGEMGKGRSTGYLLLERRGKRVDLEEREKMPVQPKTQTATNYICHHLPD